VTAGLALEAGETPSSDPESDDVLTVSFRDSRTAGYCEVEVSARNLEPNRRYWVGSPNGLRGIALDTDARGAARGSSSDPGEDWAGATADNLRLRYMDSLGRILASWNPGSVSVRGSCTGPA
jgi:hypothetical protein